MKQTREIAVVKRSPSCFEIRFSLFNKRMAVYGASVTECRKMYAEKLQEYHKPKLRRSTTFLAFYEKWLDLYKRPFVKDHTFNLIKGIFTNHILPYLADTPLKRISSTQIQRIINNLSSTPRQATICFQQLNSCLKQAFQLNLIHHNPCTAVILTKNKGKKGRALTTQEEKTLIDFLDTTNHKLKNLIKLYLYTGMRRNELLNITFEDLNFTTNEITINGTKTKNSVRVLQTLPQVLDLFPKKPQPFGELTSDYVNHEFKKICTALGLKNIVIHSLRHTFATHCIENNVSMPVLQSWLGHSSIKLTIDTYTHISEDFKRQQTQKLTFLQ